MRNLFLLCFFIHNHLSFEMKWNERIFFSFLIFVYLQTAFFRVDIYIKKTKNKNWEITTTSENENQNEMECMQKGLSCFTFLILIRNSQNTQVFSLSFILDSFLSVCVVCDFLTFLMNRNLWNIEKGRNKHKKIEEMKKIYNKFFLSSLHRLHFTRFVVIFVCLICLFSFQVSKHNMFS